QEIDLRGQRADEAWDRLDLLLDRAIPAGVPEILVVHGLGTGRLREALLERLAGDPRVARTEPAPQGRGGAGATIVHLA
ncbi:MAG: Smr/MutS family protein, partial [Candidatus Krumholzibacteriia bacterium]